MARSNRQLTQLAVDQLRIALTYGPGKLLPQKFGNTEVKVVHCTCVCNRAPHIEFSLFGKPIMEVYTSPMNHRLIVGTIVKTGDFYDSKGRPSRTTRERLNGLLDALGTAGFLPDGVRVFLREDGGCYVGKGDACKSFDAGNPAVAFLTHPTDMVFT
jgi:hypothetical protein